MASLPTQCISQAMAQISRAIAETTATAYAVRFMAFPLSESAAENFIHRE